MHQCTVFLYYALMKLKDQKLFLNAEMFSLLYYLHTWVMSNPALVSVICYLSLLISLFALRICHPCWYVESFAIQVSYLIYDPYTDGTENIIFLSKHFVPFSAYLINNNNCLLFQFRVHIFTFTCLDVFLTKSIIFLDYPCTSDTNIDVVEGWDGLVGIPKVTTYFNLVLVCCLPAAVYLR